MTKNKDQLTSQEEAKLSLSVEVESVNEQLTVAPVLTEKSSKTKEIVLQTLMLYSLLDLEKKGFVICRIKINRDVYAKHVKALEKSIEELKGAIVPIIFMPASELLEGNIAIVDMNGNEISKATPNLELHIVIIDGQHRTTAWNNLRNQGKVYNIFGMLPMVKGDVIELLKHTNTLVHAWTGLDYTTQAIQRMKEKGLATDATEWYKKIAHEDGISNSSASLWASDRIVSKAIAKKAIDKADKDATELKCLFDNDFLQQRKDLFNATVEKLGTKIAGLKIVPKELFGILEKMNKAKKYDKVSTSNKYGMLVEFINSLTDDSIKVIKRAKNDKNTKNTKDSIIAAEIHKAFEEFEKNQ